MRIANESTQLKLLQWTTRIYDTTTSDVELIGQHRSDLAEDGGLGSRALAERVGKEVDGIRRRADD